MAHRDIKLENVLLDESMKPVLADLDFAVKVPSNGLLSDFSGYFGLRSSFPGTAGYLGPEAYKRKVFDPFPLDMFALGVSLFLTFTWEYPFGFNPIDSASVYLNTRFKEKLEKLKKAKRLSGCAVHIVSSLLRWNPGSRPKARMLLQHPWFIPD